MQLFWTVQFAVVPILLFSLFGDLLMVYAAIQLPLQVPGIWLTDLELMNVCMLLWSHIKGMSW